MGVWWFAPSMTSGQPQHVAHDTPMLMTTADVPAGAFYAFPDILLPPVSVFENAHYTVNAGQTGDQPITYQVVFVCTPKTTSSFSIGFYNLTGATIQKGTAFQVAFTCIGE